MIELLLGPTLVIFMVGNLLGMGLTVRLADAFSALRDARFVVLTLVWCFVLSPALAALLAAVMPLAEPYAIGLMFLGMAPCAPFLPMVAKKAGGDVADVAAFVLLTAAGTVITMPFLVPVLVKGFTADPWTIARPLVLFIAAPLAAGVAVRQVSESFADRAAPLVTRLTGIDTLVMLGLIVVLYGSDFIGMIGTYAIGTLVLFCAVLTSAPYRLAFQLPHARRSVLALGVGTRNIGAAIAPLFAAGGTDRRAIAMCVVAVPVTVVCSLVAARIFAAADPAKERVSADVARS